MVICDRPLGEVCPIEWATRADRSVLQWDKDDCASAGLVKFDLLGLGMLSALHGTIDLIAAHHGVEVDLALLPQEDAVYDMICAADTIGVFQIESRAQMATLPRLRPRCFYDLVVEVALIRPGPIQGGSVHPYIRRRNGREPVTYPHPLCENALAKTLGIPLFQEQLMQLAIDVAGFSPVEADRLRQAMAAKRSHGRMAALHDRFTAGAAERGVPCDVVERLWDKLAAFADYGFPESHSVSFAYLVYASSWLKHHYPGGVLCGAAERPAHGLLRPAHPRPGRPSPRGRGAHPRPEPLVGRGHPRGSGRRPGRAPGRGVGARGRRRPGRGHRRRPPLPVDRGPPAADRPRPGGARGARHRRGVRMPRSGPAPGPVGGRGPSPPPASTDWRESSPASTPRRCRN